MSNYDSALAYPWESRFIQTIISIVLKIFLTLFILFRPALAMAGRISCAKKLVDVSPQFDPDLRLTAKDRVVRFRSETIQFTPMEYFILQSLLLAPEQIISRDRLIEMIWADKEPEGPEQVISQLVSRIRRKFTRVDAGFYRLRKNYGGDFFWASELYRKLTLGRVGVALHVHEGYANEQSIALTPGEHRILLTLLRRRRVSYYTADVSGHPSLSVLACRLNKKFKDILGHRLMVPGEHESQAMVLNPKLMKP